MSDTVETTTVSEEAEQYIRGAASRAARGPILSGIVNDLCAQQLSPQAATSLRMTWCSRLIGSDGAQLNLQKQRMNFAARFRRCSLTSTTMTTDDEGGADDE